MRKVLIVALSGAALLAACEKKPAQVPRAPAPPGSAPAAQATPAAALPRRAPGLWEQKVTSAGRTQASQICLDAATEARLTVWGQAAGQDQCSQSEVRPRPGGGWSIASICKMDEGGVVSTRGEVTGDFAKAYRMEAQNTISGASSSLMNGTHNMTIEAAWKGPCPAGLKGGDVLLPGGMRINLLQNSAP